MVISLKDAYAALKGALSPEIEESAFEARELLAAVFGVSRGDILAGREIAVAEAQAEALKSLARRRLNREPLQYLLGEWDFYGRTFQVGEGVLIPRPDTEALAGLGLAFLKEKDKPRVLDLCAGTGCIAITIALEHPGAEVWALEKSPLAWGYFTANNRAFGSPVRGVLGDALNLESLPLPGDFDLILSNPPYLTRGEMAALQPEVAREPAMALDGGEDGLFFYRALTPLYVPRLKPGGMLAYEIGMGQEEAVSEILRSAGLDFICQTPDLHGIIRVISGAKQLTVDSYGAACGGE